MIHVLYTGRNLRARRRETIANPPVGVTYGSQYSIENMPTDHKLTGNKGLPIIYEILLKIVSILQVPNLLFLSKKILHGYDLLHTPGQLVINNKPYIVEIDNVACLSFYKLSTLFGFLGKRVITYFLIRKNCKKILCISEAAKKSIIHFFNNDIITKKCVVSYPFVTDKGISLDDIHLQSNPALLYISSDFYLKGGRELIKAYMRVKKIHPHIQLTIITKIPSITEEDQKLLQTTDIRLVEANISKDILYCDYYLTHDIFIGPTYKDSFGLVFLEALSCGLAIIATDMFAVKEMVIDEYNGRILPPPINIFDQHYLPDPKRWDKDISNFVIKNTDYFNNFTDDLTSIIDNIVSDKKNLLQYKQNSLRLFQEKFHNDVRTKHLGKIYLDSLK